MNVVHNLR